MFIHSLFVNSLLSVSFDYRGWYHLATVAFCSTGTTNAGWSERRNREKGALNFLTVLDGGVISVTLMELELVP